jgi:hypothetical protein
VGREPPPPGRWRAAREHAIAVASEHLVNMEFATARQAVRHYILGLLAQQLGSQQIFQVFSRSVTAAFP